MSKRTLIDVYGPTALVTGAASGIGAAFAQQLATQGFSLIMVDRDAPGLAALAAQLRAGAHVRVDAFPGDLTSARFES